MSQHEYAIHHIQSPYVQLFIILLASFMAILDTSVVQVAIPTMEAALSASTDQIQWVLTGYLLVIGVMIPITGWLIDRFGAKNMFVVAVLVFTVGSALCGAAWNLPSIIVFRILQGIGAGIMTPLATAMIFMIFPPDKRGTAMGLFGIVIMAAPAFGPLLSGWLVQEASWRLIFFINVPIGIVATVLGITRLYRFPHARKAPLDVAGFVLSVTGLFALLYGFTNVSQYGWTNWRVEPFLAAGTVLLILLIGVEWRQPAPLIQLRVFKDYMFSLSQLIVSLVYAAMYMGLFLMPIFLQDTLNYTALQTGAFLTPAAIISAIS
ncbi:MAG: DHA2 family efflux MFS transporter permease subunit, partial [Sulfobacillus sp.]|nr:DHA2 family efflux MFS transporter permease subunit [Sulfobacillus sp.]